MNSVPVRLAQYYADPADYLNVYAPNQPGRLELVDVAPGTEFTVRYFGARWLTGTLRIRPGQAVYAEAAEFDGEPERAKYRGSTFVVYRCPCETPAKPPVVWWNPLGLRQKIEVSPVEQWVPDGAQIGLVAACS